MKIETPLHLGSRPLIDGKRFRALSDALPDRVDQRQPFVDGQAENRIVVTGCHVIHPAPVRHLRHCTRRRAVRRELGPTASRWLRLATFSREHRGPLRAWQGT